MGCNQLKSAASTENAKWFRFPQPVDLIWLGGLDSNQDSQIQSLESYQLDDLPTAESVGPTSCHGLKFWVKRAKRQRPPRHSRQTRPHYAWRMPLLHPCDAETQRPVLMSFVLFNLTDVLSPCSGPRELGDALVVRRQSQNSTFSIATHWAFVSWERDKQIAKIRCARSAAQ